jgi:hypothetical protein
VRGPASFAAASDACFERRWRVTDPAPCCRTPEPRAARRALRYQVGASREDFSSSSGARPVVHLLAGLRARKGACTALG